MQRSRKSKPANAGIRRWGDAGAVVHSNPVTNGVITARKRWHNGERSIKKKGDATAATPSALARSGMAPPTRPANAVWIEPTRGIAHGKNTARIESGDKQSCRYGGNAALIMTYGGQSFNKPLTHQRGEILFIANKRVDCASNRLR